MWHHRNGEHSSSTTASRSLPSGLEHGKMKLLRCYGTAYTVTLLGIHIRTWQKLPLLLPITCMEASATDPIGVQKGRYVDPVHSPSRVSSVLFQLHYWCSLAHNLWSLSYPLSSQPSTLTLGSCSSCSCSGRISAYRHREMVIYISLHWWNTS
jgi:hypothetical protein